MSQEQDENLPDTLTPGTPLISEGATQLPPIWGRLVQQRIYLPTIELRKDTYTFGRNPNCDINVSLKNLNSQILQSTSKQHFLIGKDRTNVPFIKDLSKNGTYLNGEYIGKNRMKLLRDGDILSVGSCVNKVYTYKDEPNNFISPEFDAKYKITRLIGNGAFGEVFLAISRKVSHRYAVKKIKITGREESKITNEINILEQLDHPNVIKMYETFYAQNHVYIILEYMEGGELQSRVLKRGKLKESVAKLYVYQIALAVRYLHDSNITHRDLKPENVLLHTNKSTTLLKVTDFGLSKIVGDSCVMKSLCGSPLYVAPEIVEAMGRRTFYTPQVDVWSLGCITYFNLFGETPFESPTNDETNGEDGALVCLYRRIRRGHFLIPVKRDENDQCEKYGASDDAVDLIKLMLTLNPKQRITIDAVLNHEWFQDDALKKNVSSLLA